eukprot:12171850-Karenia_brevis.AAC.1
MAAAAGARQSRALLLHVIIDVSAAMSACVQRDQQAHGLNMISFKAAMEQQWTWTCRPAWTWS